MNGWMDGELTPIPPCIYQSMYLPIDLAIYVTTYDIPAAGRSSRVKGALQLLSKRHM